MNEDELKKFMRASNMQMQALHAGVLALIRTHQNPLLFLSALDLYEQAGMANALYISSDRDISVY